MYSSLDSLDVPVTFSESGRKSKVVVRRLRRLMTKYCEPEKELVRVTSAYALSIGGTDSLAEDDASVSSESSQS